MENTLEKLQEKAPHPLEIAEALRAYMEKGGLTQSELAKATGKKRSTVANYLRLLKLPEKMKEAFQRGMFTLGHAKLLLGATGTDQEKLFQRIIEGKLTVRQSAREDHKGNDPFLKEVEKKAEEKLGTKVKIRPQGSGGEVSVSYYSYDDLDRLLSLWGIADGD